MALRDPLRVA